MASRFFFRPLFWPTLMTALVLPILVGLGLWQLDRLEWKRTLIAQIETRLAEPAIPLPPPEDWAALDPDALQYHRVTVTGVLDHDREVHWFANPVDGRIGYHIITPLAVATGAYVLVDRGFVPVELKDPALRRAGQTIGQVTVTGVARASTRRGWLDVADDPENNVWLVRNIAAMAKAAGLPVIAPILIEAEAAYPEEQALDSWPQALWPPRLVQPGPAQIGARPPIEIRNAHLDYALTWFGLGLALVIIYGAYHGVQGRLGFRATPPGP